MNTPNTIGVLRENDECDFTYTHFTYDLGGEPTTYPIHAVKVSYGQTTTITTPGGTVLTFEGQDTDPDDLDPGLSSEMAVTRLTITHEQGAHTNA